MGVGVIGIVRPSDVSYDNIEMFYNYVSDRTQSNNVMIRLEPSEMLEYCYLPNGDESDYGENIIEGLYNLKLPATIFNQLGIYTIYIKPKSILSIISDCGVLSALPTVNGIVIDITDLPSNLTINNALQGYRIEYIDNNNNKTRNLVRYVVSSNKVSVINENQGNTSQKALRYRFDDAGTLLFLQLTPSSSSDVKPNATPFIGNVGQQILISNTFFSPVCVEIEMVENTIDTLSDIIAGEQIKDVDNGILTYYDKNRIITKQFNLYEIKEDITNQSLYEVKEKRTTIDETQDFNSIIDGVV